MLPLGKSQSRGSSGSQTNSPGKALLLNAGFILLSGAGWGYSSWKELGTRRGKGVRGCTVKGRLRPGRY